MIGEQGVEGTAKEKRQEGKGRGKEEEGAEKKDVGFDVEVGRILESSQNEVRGSMNLTINQPLLSLLPLSGLLLQAGPLYLRSRSPLCFLPSRGIKPRSHKALLLISYFFLRHVLSTGAPV